MSRSKLQILYEIFASSKFFYTLVLVFVISAVSIAYRSVFPMAFDEEVHLGLIRIYSDYLVPFQLNTTPDMAIYGAVPGDPSYLFHYLFSFPYRLLVSMNLNETAIIFLLRLINIAFVVSSLFIFRAVLKQAGMSRMAQHAIIAIYCFVPILPFMAAQINYDNLFLPLIALNFYFAIRIIKTVSAGSGLPIYPTWGLITTSLFVSPVKYAALPLVLANILIVIGYILYVKRTKITSDLKILVQSTVKKSWLKLSVLLVVVALGLVFNLRYVTNTINYGSPIPKCDAVYSDEACQAFGPYRRTTRYMDALPSSFKPASFPVYMATEWIPGMLFRLTFTLAGPTNLYDTKQPLAIPIAMYSLFAAIGASSILLASRRLIKNPVWVLLVGSSLLYIMTLAIKLYTGYTQTGQPAAINGRYLLPVLPLLAAATIIALRSSSIKRFFTQKTKVCIFATVFAVLLLGGGGGATYFVQAESNWLYDR